jgi:hypothetical protein
MAKAARKARTTKTKKATPKTKKTKPLMKFLEESATEAQRKEANRIWRDFGTYIFVNNRKYEIQSVHFYDKNGVVYTSRHLDAPGYDSRRFRQIVFDKKFVWKRKIKFDSNELMLKSFGKSNFYPYDLVCDLYVPIEYLKADGAKIVEEVSENNYERRSYKYLRSKHIEIHLESKVEDFFKKRLNDLIKAVEQAKSEEEIKQSLSAIMNIHAR